MHDSPSRHSSRWITFLLNAILSLCDCDYSMSSKFNPYEPSPIGPMDRLECHERLTGKQVAYLQKVVFRFGLFAFIWNPLVCYWTDALNIDIWALFIASNGLRTNWNSLSKFPWTAVMCSVYPLLFLTRAASIDARELNSWLPARHSPVLSLELITAIWALYAAYCLYNAHRIRSREPSDWLADDEVMSR